jgi:cytochrome c oxidase subunit 2
MGNSLRFLISPLLGLGLMIALLPKSAPAPQTTQEITIEADDFTYTPTTIKVQQGDIVTLRFAPQDVVHGLAIDGYDVNLVADPGQPAEVTFVADRSGTFRFRCSVSCGSLHPFMTGELHVGPNTFVWRAVALTLLAAFGGSALFWRRTAPEVKS